MKAVGVWDTVGTLGVPEVKVLGHTLFPSNSKEYSFVDTKVPANLEYAYHALALDEQRQPFGPTIWEYPKADAASRLKLLKQCWFPGMHSHVGGGYRDTSIADISLAWMMTQLARHLTFDPNYTLLQQKQNEQFYSDLHVPMCSWAMGKIEKSDAGLFNTLGGKQSRTPGEYHATDPKTGKPLDRGLANTCEFVHSSVRYRMQQKGPGLAESATVPGEGVYSPVTLNGWQYCAPGQPLPDKNTQLDSTTHEWDDFGKWFVRRDDGSCTFIVEDRIEEGAEEMSLIKAWPGVAETVI